MVFWAVVPPSFGYDWGALSNDLREEFGEVNVCLATSEQGLRKMVKVGIVPILQKQ
jgi:hypothetical protein